MSSNQRTSYKNHEMALAADGLGIAHPTCLRQGDEADDCPKSFLILHSAIPKCSSRFKIFITQTTQLYTLSLQMSCLHFYPVRHWQKMLWISRSSLQRTEQAEPQSSKISNENKWFHFHPDLQGQKLGSALCHSH